MLMVRGMRHVWKARPNLTRHEWTTLLQPVIQHGYSLQWVLTQAELLEPTYESVMHAQSPEYLALQSKHGFSARPDGLD